MKTDVSRDLELIAKKLGLDIRDVSDLPLEGLWKGVKITNRDIEEAKKAISGKS